MTGSLGSTSGSGRYLLTSPNRLDLDAFARRAGVHPDLIRRYVTLGLVPASSDARGQLWFSPAELSTVARIRRLRAGLSINYAAMGLVLDLLERIRALEAASHRGQGSGSTWT